MPGCRSLTPEEISQVLTQLNTPRDRLLLVMGLKTGFRVSELLTLKVGDVLSPAGGIVDKLTVYKINMKGKKKARTVALHGEVIALLQPYVVGKHPAHPLFESPKTGKAITRFTAYHIMKLAFDSLGLAGKLGTHSWRKVFANVIYLKSGKDLLKTSRALGHDRVMNTERYLEIKQDEIDDLIVN